MKRWIGLAVIIQIAFCSAGWAKVPAPTWNELFKQKKTQTKYSVQQIAGLQVYLELVKQGYKLAKSGLELVNTIKNGEFSLHDAYYLSLKIVSSRVRQYPNLSATINNLQFINSQSNWLRKSVRNNDVFTNDRTQFVLDCLSRLDADMAASLNELTGIISDNKLEMSDDERMKRIDQLFEYTTKRVVFIKSFTGVTIAIGRSKKIEEGEVNLLKSIYNEE